MGASSPALSGQSLAGPTRLRKTGWGGSKPEEAGPGEVVTCFDRASRSSSPLCCVVIHLTRKLEGYMAQKYLCMEKCGFPSKRNLS